MHAHDVFERRLIPTCTRVGEERVHDRVRACFRDGELDSDALDAINLLSLQQIRYWDEATASALASSCTLISTRPATHS